MDNIGIKQKPAFIWDLDGTLIDSYDVIVTSLRGAYLEAGLDIGEDEIRREVTSRSVNDFILDKEKETGIPFDIIKKRYTELGDRDRLKIKAVPGMDRALRSIYDLGARNFVFTHRGASARDILENLGILGMFEEIISAEGGFPRKPAPDGIDHLVNKYGLIREETFYVGDRTLDMECAENAGIKSILYHPDGSRTEVTGKETYVINVPEELLSLPLFNGCPGSGRVKIMVSACLLGEKCKYNGGDNRCEEVLDLIKDCEVIPVCPETAGGLPVPRVPCEIRNGRVINADGESRDAEFRRGAKLCFSRALKEKPDIVILQSRSPSCGTRQVYDGTFSGRLVKGAGIFASMLLENGFRVFDVQDIREMPPEKRREIINGQELKHG